MSNGPQWQVRPISPATLPKVVWDQLAEQQRRDHEYIRQFGHARPPVTQVFNGQRFIAVGGHMYLMPADATKYFPDFLLRFVQIVFGREWWEAELARPVEKRHPVFQWRMKAMIFQNKQLKTPDGIYVAKTTGPMAAYYTFAYDLFVVADNQRLDEKMLARLKHPEHFQGARHELFAEATCIRAGYTIEHEDESSRLSRHAEFTATHRFTGDKVSVEAKSKHRPGVMGRGGDREVPGEYDLRIGKLMNDAIAKNPPHPLVVFLDLNLPWRMADEILTLPPKRPLIHKALDMVRIGEEKLDPVSLLVATNHPAHYGQDEEETSKAHVCSLISLKPVKPMLQPDALKEIHDAAMKFTHYPLFFPEQR
ncbi:MAG: hypothetical protein WA875_14205 [Candidatus Acidiferrales bacterium]